MLCSVLRSVVIYVLNKKRKKNLKFIEDIGTVKNGSDDVRYVHINNTAEIRIS